MGNNISDIVNNAADAIINSSELDTAGKNDLAAIIYNAANRIIDAGGGGGGGDVTGVKGNAESTYRKGNVNITPENIGLGNVNNTSDAQKPVSTATQAALDLKANAADVNIFHGTAAAWDALPLSEKVKYTDAMIEGGSSDNPVGNLNSLTTTDKTSCVGAINEINDKIGQISLGEITASGERDFVEKVCSALVSLNLPLNYSKAFDVSYANTSLFTGVCEWVSDNILFVFLFRSGYQFTASYNKSSQITSAVKYTGTTL